MVDIDSVIHAYLLVVTIIALAGYAGWGMVARLGYTGTHSVQTTTGLIALIALLWPIALLVTAVLILFIAAEAVLETVHSEKS